MGGNTTQWQSALWIGMESIYILDPSYMRQELLQAGQGEETLLFPVTKEQGYAEER